MKRIISKPHLFFFGLVPIFIILGFVKKDAIIDINVSYIYFELLISTLCYLSAIFFFLIGLNYFSVILSGKKLKKGLTITHIVFQLLSFIPFLFILLTATKSGEIDANNQQTLELFSIIILVGSLLFLASILIHLINFSLSMFLKK